METCMEYETFAGDLDQQEKLMALDYMDEVRPGFVKFNLCRAKVSEGCTCGIFMPGKLWYRPTPKWRFLLQSGLESGPPRGAECNGEEVRQQPRVLAATRARREVHPLGQGR